MSRFRFIGLVTLGLVASTGFADDSEAENWLMRMAQALKNLSYQGTFVYLNGAHLESMRVVRVVDQRGEREHLVSLNGSRREILRNGHAVTRILPHARSVSTQRSAGQGSFPLALGESFNALLPYYGFRLGGWDRIAERKTRRVAVIPKDEYRYGYRLWLDAATAIPLRVALLNQQGRPLEQVMFTSFNLLDETSLPPKLPVMESSPAVREIREQPERTPETTTAWRVGKLPNGFALKEQREERIPGSSRQIQHLLFSDGLVSVSAYIEPMEKRRGLEGPSSRGSVSAYGRYQAGYQVTVVGEVPTVTVEQIARAIQVSER
ncbi:MAG: MucB/RseB C-terminal domain-containing protein [Gammaproteobacteria bacterium]